MLMCSGCSIAPNTVSATADIDAVSAVVSSDNYIAVISFCCYCNAVIPIILIDTVTSVLVVAAEFMFVLLLKL